MRLASTLQYGPCAGTFDRSVPNQCGRLNPGSHASNGSAVRLICANGWSGGGDSNVSMPGIRAKNGANVGFEATMMRAPRFASSGM
jgi:hypothetical protein